MANLVVLFTLCLLPALSLADNPFRLHGRVYCDTCRCGFENSATRYLAGAKVQVECLDRTTLQRRYTLSAITDATGTYEMEVPTDHGDQKCECALVSSPDPTCAEPNIGRHRSTVILTRENGMNKDTRSANNMGFLATKPLPGCKELIKSYFPEEI